MAWTKKESPFDRRMRELRREAEALNKNIRDVSKSMRKLDTLPDKSRPVAGRREPIPHDPVAAPAPGSEVHKGYRASADSAGGLYRRDEAMGTHSGGIREVPAHAVIDVSGDDALPGESRRKPVMRNERFANYFSSGSFGKSGPLVKEKKLQRNKAIFMLIFVLLVAYLVLRAML